ncbi:MAG: hypothetical protein E6X86_04660 [Clostridium butyricum]|uniref:hypothetical protein n=1 Tax=Clostridium butyricum TaxID=1492 RepID=UPI0005EAEC48|nr:hypothetical protein [Clostridium butyricum]MDU4750302.1 hypothetical protein [Clostridium butyricum]MDU4853391.1 hypothetical protein [Clostridioides difficile]
MDIKELKEQLLQGTFYYYIDTLLIHAKVKNICSVGKDSIHIGFEGGAVTVGIDNIKPIKRPGNILEKFNWCYVLRSYDNKCIGYIGEIEN